MNTKQGILLIGIALLIFCAFVGTISAADIYVPDNYTKIQWAIDNATEGSNIIVRDGTYTENVDVDMRLTIRSENGSVNCTVKAKNSDDYVFEVKADYVNLSGFMVTGATEWAGIFLGSGVDHCKISNNNASNSGNGIELWSSSNNTLIDNIASNNYWGDLSTGIYLYSSSNNTLTNNTCSENSNYGIWLSYSNNNLIFRNNLISNSINAEDDNPASNDWYHPVRLEGNYWSDYTGVDDGSGTGKYAIAGDGIGDTDIPHPTADFDFYPFMNESLWNNIKVSMETATGTGTVTLSTSGGYFSYVSAVNESSLPSEGKPDILFPHGLFSFNIAGLNTGDIINVTIELPNDLPTNSQYWKYGPNGSTINPQPERWYQIPMGSNDGDNIITIQLTDGGAGDDDGIANGIIIDQGGPALIPDLTLNSSDITFSPESPTEDDSVTITAIVHNVGGADANNFTVSFFDGPSLIGNDTISVNVNSTSFASIIWAAVSGNHSIRVVTDSGNVILESNETNNEASRAITVKKKPDLTLNSSDISFSPTSPTEGDSVNLTTIIHNIGETDANNFTVSFFDGTSLIVNDTISVNANSTSSASITWTAVSGDHNIRVVADPGNVIVESDETNNEANRTITVKEPQPPLPVHRPGGGGAPRDSDGDGYSDTTEMLAGTDPNDPCDPNPEGATCLALKPPMPTPTPSVTPTLPFSDIIKEEFKKLPFGRILYSIPEKMEVDVKERIEVRITQNITENLTRGLKGQGVPQTELIKVGTFMKARLTGDNFDITPLSHEEQPVLPEVVTQWSWDVTPLEPGNQTLNLLVTVRIKIQGDGEEYWDYPVLDRYIDVKADPLGTFTKWLKSNWQWIVEMLIASGIISSIIIKRDIIKSWFRRRRKKSSQSQGKEEKEKKSI